MVTQNDAFLFTDGRYFLQAEKQLDKYDLSASQCSQCSQYIVQELDSDEARPSKYLLRLGDLV